MIVFVWCFTSLSRIFRPYEAITIAGEELIIWLRVRDCLTIEYKYTSICKKNLAVNSDLNPPPPNEVPLGVGIIRFVSFQYRWIFRTSIRSRDLLEKVKIAIWPPGDRWRFLQKCGYEIDRLVVTTFICTIFKHLMICLCIDSICDSVNLLLCLSINFIFT